MFRQWKVLNVTEKSNAMGRHKKASRAWFLQLLAAHRILPEDCRAHIEKVSRNSKSKKSPTGPTEGTPKPEYTEGCPIQFLMDWSPSWQAQPVASNGLSTDALLREQGKPMTRLPMASEVNEQMSNEKNTGYLPYIGDYGIPKCFWRLQEANIRIPSLNNQDSMERMGPRLFFVAQMLSLFQAGETNVDLFNCHLYICFEAFALLCYSLQLCFINSISLTYNIMRIWCQKYRLYIYNPINVLHIEAAFFVDHGMFFLATPKNGNLIHLLRMKR